MFLKMYMFMYTTLLHFCFAVSNRVEVEMVNQAVLLYFFLMS